MNFFKYKGVFFVRSVILGPQFESYHISAIISLNDVNIVLLITSYMDSIEPLVRRIKSRHVYIWILIILSTLLSKAKGRSTIDFNVT